MEEQLLTLYRKAINRIDDYFEYSMQSEKDQKRVHEILAKLSNEIALLKGN